MSVLAVSSEMMVQMVLITSSFNRTHVDPTSKYILNTQFSHPQKTKKTMNERKKVLACFGSMSRATLLFWEIGCPVLWSREDPQASTSHAEDFGIRADNRVEHLVGSPEAVVALVADVPGEKVDARLRRGGEVGVKVDREGV